SNYAFNSWTGTGAGSYTGTSKNTYITLNNPITETASFTSTAPQLIFIESGLPSGSKWSVSIYNNFVVAGINSNGVYVDSHQQPIAVESSTTSKIVFNNLKGGIYTYVVNSSDISTGNAYIPTPYESTINFGGSNLYEYITFNHEYWLNMSPNSLVSPTSSWENANSYVKISAKTGTSSSWQSNGCTYYYLYTFNSWTGTGTGSYTGTANPSEVHMLNPIFEYANVSSQLIKYCLTSTTSITTETTTSTTTETTTSTKSSTSTTTTIYTGPQISVTFKVNSTCYGNTGTFVVVDGNDYTCSQLPVTFSWQPYTTHSYAFQSPVYTTAQNQRFYYNSVSGCGASGQSGSITPSGNCNVTGYYTTQYLLSMPSTPNGAGTLSPGTEWLNPGTSVSISETPNDGYIFENWTGTGTGSYSGTAKSAQITIGSPIIENANYKAPKYNYTVTFEVNNTNFDSYYKNSNCHIQYPEGVECDGVTSPTSYSAGTSGSLWASIPTGYQFVKWVGSGSGSYTGTNLYGTATVNSNITEELYIEPVPKYNVTFEVNNTNFDSYYKNSNCHIQYPEGVECDGVTSPTSYSAGTSGSLWASIPTGYQFVKWVGSGSGSYTGTNLDGTATVNSNITEELYIKYVPAYKVTFAFNPSPSQNSSVCSSSSDVVSIGGTSYTCSQLPVTFIWNSTSSHSYSFYSTVTTGYPVKSIYSSVSGCGAYSQSGSITPSGNCTVTGYYTTQYLLSMASSPNGAGSLSPGTEWLNSGTYVTINETPKSGYKFNFWTGRGSGSYSGSATSSGITIDGPVVETANYSRG
ncbi:MAG: InlB B-repeat-containing protein, partial [Candidatus Micrarchaeia archaeon]